MLRLIPFEEARHAHLVPEVTKLLHAAYAPLRAENLHYLASHQGEEKTLERLTEGQGWLIYYEQQLAGTVSLYEGAKKKIACNYYRRPGIWLFGQFAVRPQLQSKGLGSQVMDFLEGEAAGRGALELALDTSEHAHRLIAMYVRRGYEVVDATQWPDVNYRSVILAKKLA
jgi:GNAT superfamily N-acetyltransferase